MISALLTWLSPFDSLDKILKTFEKAASRLDKFEVDRRADAATTLLLAEQAHKEAEAAEADADRAKRVREKIGELTA